MCKIFNKYFKNVLHAIIQYTPASVASLEVVVLVETMRNFLFSRARMLINRRRSDNSNEGNQTTVFDLKQDMTMFQPRLLTSHLVSSSGIRAVETLQLIRFMRGSLQNPLGINSIPKTSLLIWTILGLILVLNFYRILSALFQYKKLEHDYCLLIFENLVFKLYSEIFFVVSFFS